METKNAKLCKSEKVSMSIIRQMLCVCVVVITTAPFSNTAFATDWWQRTQDFIGSDTGQKIFESLNTQNESKSYSGVQEVYASKYLTAGEIDSGLRQALSVGTQRVVNQIGVIDGFNLDPKIHIPLPGTLQKVKNILSSVGMGSLADDLELKLNRAAEAATPKAKQLFLNAISQMTITDAKNILTGPEDSATRFLRSAMGDDLRRSMQPIISDAVARVGAIQAYDVVMRRYHMVPFMPDVKADLNAYVVEKAMDGIFYYVAREEAAIRENPAARTTELLRKVFSY